MHTPKHVLLPRAVKNLTGSTEVVSILNRFGHGMSRSQLQAIENDLAEKQLDKEIGVCLPSNCQPNVFATFCWDNNDLSEETLSGKGTTHCTNGIVIQKKVDGCAPKPAQTVSTQNRGQRSTTLVPDFVLPYSAGKRVGPSRAVPVDVEILEKTKQILCQRQAQHVDFAWFLARLPLQETLFDADDHLYQTVPGWSAFNAKTQDTNVKCSVIGYSQVIDASPTELATVYTVLKRSLAMGDQLGQHDIIVVFDQAIYAKALDIIWKRPEEFDRIVICMGAFHISCALLAVIGKRFGDAGLSDLLVESEVIWQGL